MKLTKVIFKMQILDGCKSIAGILSNAEMHLNPGIQSRANIIYRDVLVYLAEKISNFSKRSTAQEAPFLLVILLGGTLFISGCSEEKSGSAAKPLVQSNRTDNVASCTYQFDQGGTAPSIAPHENIKLSLFDKKYNQSLLNSVLNVSGAELVRFASLFEVQFYKVINPYRQTCLFTNSLPSAPAVLEKHFNKVEAGSSAAGDEKTKTVLLGLYLSVDKMREIVLRSGVNPSSLNMNSSILVRNDSDKYTMTHEFMHHLFSKEGLVGEASIIKNADDSAEAFLRQLNLSENQIETIQSYQDLQKYVENYKIDSIEDYERHVMLLEGMTINYLNVLKEFTLEEVAIESELSEKYEKRQFTFVDERRRVNGDKYLIMSAMEASKSLEIFIKFIQVYRAKESQLNDQEDQLFIEKLNKVKKKLSLLSQKIFDVKAIAATAAFKAELRLKNSYCSCGK
jgi:hypothetical protein